MSTPLTGVKSQIGIGSALPVTERYDAYSCGLGKVATLIDSDEVMRGHQGNVAAAVAAGPYKVEGPLELPCSAAVLDLWLPRIMGLTGSAGTAGTKYLFDDDTPSFYAVVDRIAKVHTYSGVQVNKATFKGSKGKPMTLELELWGLTESEENAGTFPTLTATVSTPIYAFNGGTAILNGAARDIDNVEIVVDWDRDGEQFYNNITRVALPPQNRKVTFAADIPYNSTNADLRDQNVAGAAGTLEWVIGVHTLQFNLNALQVPAKPVPIQGKKVMVWRVEGTVRGTEAGNDELVIESST